MFQWRWFSWNPPVVFEVDVMGAPWTALTMVDFTRFVWQNIYIYSVYMVEYNLVVYYNYDHITINHYFLDIGVTFLPAFVGMFPEQYQWSLGSKTLRRFVALGETSGNKCMFWFMMIYDGLWWFHNLSMWFYEHKPQLCNCHMLDPFFWRTCCDLEWSWWVQGGSTKL